MNLTLKVGGYSYSNNTKDYTYQDINSDLLLNSNKTDTLPNRDINAIFGSLRNLFIYTPGERMLNPEFGLNLKGLLYEAMTDKIAKSIGMEIYNGINRWEPRVKIESLEIIPDYDDNTYYITIKFKCTQLKVDETYYFNYSLARTL